MEEKEKIRAALNECITDACNRYLNALDEIGLVDSKKRVQSVEVILRVRNGLMDEWMPTYLKRIADSTREDV